jgi:hypothetical protein
MANETVLEDFTKDELLALAEEFGVEVKASMSKAVVVEAFKSDGVTPELINGLRQDAVEDEVEETVEVPAAPVEAEVEEEALVLIKMTRPNRSYEVRGYRFTQEHPFSLVTEDNADFLIETEGGFRMASPKEAREYYS